MADHFRTDPGWEDIRVFIALARHGSLSGAARALAVNHATVARRLSSLEQALGDKLVERRPDGYVLTPSGTQALAAANDMEAAAASLFRGGLSGGPSGLVRINATPSLMQGFLVTRMAVLVGQYPALDVELATNIRSISLERREADIALRLGRPDDGDIIAKRLLSLGYGLYGSAVWNRRIDAGETPVFVGFDEANAHLPEAVWLDQHFPRKRVAFRTNSQFAQAAAARADAGIALLPHFIARADDALVLCHLDTEPPSRDLWMLTRRQERRDAPIQIVKEYLKEIFLAERALFEDGL
jgi:DNA-binding transcriptional LysR family regulator